MITESLKRKILSKDFAERLNEICLESNSFEFYKELKADLPFLDKFVRNMKKDCKMINVFSKSRSLEEMNFHAMKFYENLDAEIYDRLKFLLYDKSTQVSVCDPVEKFVSSSASLFETNKNGMRIVSLHPKMDFEGLFCYVHEYAHLMCEDFVNFKMNNFENNISEVPSLCMEKVYANWLVKNGIISIDEYNCFKLREITTFVSFVGKLFLDATFFEMVKPPVTEQKLLMVEYIFNNHPILKDNYEEFLLRLNEIVTENKPTTYIFRYVVGELVGGVFLDDFKKDSVSAVERYKKLIKNIDKLKSDEAVETLIGKDYKKRIEKKYLNSKLSRNKAD